MLEGYTKVLKVYRQEYNRVKVSGDKIGAIRMIPSWKHNIIYLRGTENLVIVMTCNEIIDLV